MHFQVHNLFLYYKRKIYFRYKFLVEEKLGEENPFKIHPETGLISTRLPLDREKKSSYDLIIVAEDRGEVPQQATRILRVSIDCSSRIKY